MLRYGAISTEIRCLEENPYNFRVLDEEKSVRIQSDTGFSLRPGYGLFDRLSHDTPPSLPSRLGTEYRFKVLRGEVRIREFIRQVCAGMGVTIINGALSSDHTMCSSRSRRMSRSETSCGAPRAGHRARPSRNSSTSASATWGQRRPMILLAPAG